MLQHISGKETLIDFVFHDGVVVDLILTAMQQWFVGTWNACTKSSSYSSTTYRVVVLWTFSNNSWENYIKYLHTKVYKCSTHRRLSLIPTICYIVMEFSISNVLVASPICLGHKKSMCLWRQRFCCLYIQVRMLQNVFITLSCGHVLKNVSVISSTHFAYDFYILDASM